MRTEAPLLAPIFRSDGQARLLAALIVMDEELSITDLAKRTDLAYPTVHREVGRLLDAGILAERQVGRTRLIRAAEDSPLVEPLRLILTITTGPAVHLGRELSGIEGVEAAFLYGSFAARSLGVPEPAPSDVDVMVVGSPDTDEVYSACDRVQERVGRAVNPTILTAKELSADSGFLVHVKSNPVIPVIGDLPW